LRSSLASSQNSCHRTNADAVARLAKKASARFARSRASCISRVHSCQVWKHPPMYVSRQRCIASSIFSPSSRIIAQNSAHWRKLRAQAPIIQCRMLAFARFASWQCSYIFTKARVSSRLSQ